MGTNNKGISIRGETYQKLKALAHARGYAGPSALAQEWIQEYAPFTDKVPKPLPGVRRVQRKRPPKPKPEVARCTDPVPHPIEPVDPPDRDEEPKRKPSVTLRSEPVELPEDTPDGSGYGTL